MYSTEDSALTNAEMEDSWDENDPYDSDFDEDYDDDHDSDVEDLTPGSSQARCSICLRCRSAASLRLCCQTPCCEHCLYRYLNIKVNSGVASIQCPGSGCDSYLKEYEISSRLDYNSRQKFHKLLIDARNDPACKTCPRCGQGMRVEHRDMQKLRGVAISRGNPVTCQSCALKWCFTCHAPWHENVTCEEYVLGDRQFRNWVKSRGPGDQINAQRCPSCQTYIQRIDGCDSMTCARCGTNFCYQCGYKFPLTTKRITWTGMLPCFFMGEHNGKWSPLSCPGKLLPNSPYRRKLVKSLILGGKVLGTIVLPPLLLILALALMVVAAIPVLVGVKVYPKVRQFYEKRRRAKIGGPTRHGLRTTMAMFGYRNCCLFGLGVLGMLGIVGLGVLGMLGIVGFLVYLVFWGVFWLLACLVGWIL